MTSIATITAADALTIIAGHITITRAGLGGAAHKAANDGAWDDALALLDEHMGKPNVDRTFSFLTFLCAVRMGVNATSAMLRAESLPLADADKDDEWDHAANLERVRLTARLEVMTNLAALVTDLNSRLAAA